jgi:basic membrane protein A
MGHLHVVVLATVLIALGFVGVGAGPSDAGTGARKLRVGLVLEPGGRDDPYVRIALTGFRRAVRELDVEGRVLTQGPKESAFPSLAYLARQGYDLVIGEGINQADALDAAARAFPNTRFAIADTPWENLKHRPRNVLGTRYRMEEAAYLAGYLAALMEKRRPGKDVVSSVGGFPIPTVDPFIAGFRAGARKASPRITRLNAYSNDWLDQEKCRRIALGQIARGSGVVFQVAGGCGLGALAAAKQHGVFGIGVDYDQSFLGPYILTSVLKRMDVAVYDAIRALKRGKFRPGRSAVFDLRNGGVGLGVISPRVPRALVERVERVRKQIVAGEIHGIPTSVR